MVPLQDIDISTNNEKKMQITLRSQDNGFFVLLQELITEGPYAGIYSELSRPLFKFKNAGTAFEYAVKALRVFLSYAKDDIKSVNNRNCELLSQPEQQSVLLSLGLTISPGVKLT